jgi:GNAT superfamily N-acetyltransferase
MNWRVECGGDAWRRAKGEPNRRAFRQLVTSGRATGVLARAGREPIGWCSVGPARAFPRLMKSRALRRERSSATWSVTCFYISKPWRGRGLSIRLLEAGVRLAAARGASEVEGFPVVTNPKKRRLPCPFVWTGVPAIFSAAGFHPISNRVGMRPIFLRKVPPAKRPRGAGATGA